MGKPAIAETGRGVVTDFRKRGVGVIDCNLSATDTDRHTGRPSAFYVARRVGADGVQLSIGRELVDEVSMPLFHPVRQRRLVDASKETGVAITSLRLNRWQVDNPVSDVEEVRARADHWLWQSLSIAQALGATPENPMVLLTPHFGDGEIRTREQMERAAAAYRRIIPAAAEVGMVVGVEETMSVRNKLRLLEMVGDVPKVGDNVPVLGYYLDIGNENKFERDPVEVIYTLGDNVVEVHYKDSATLIMDPATGKKVSKMEPRYLDQGRSDYPGRINYQNVTQALVDNDFNGWVVLETNDPREDLDFDVPAHLRAAQFQESVEGALSDNILYVKNTLFVPGAQAA